MSKKIGLLTFLFICLRVGAQEKITPTNHFIIEGKVKASIEFTIDQVMQMPSKHIDSCVTKNHLLQKKHTLMNLEGVPLKTILNKVEIAADNPKQLSEFYFVFIAADNYKAVYSWNEIFNSATGDNVYILKERDGEKISQQNDAISILCTTDNATGRRYVKALQKILVERIN